mgnify:CR=1 FL=1
MTIQDLLDLFVDNACDIYVYDMHTEKEREYDRDNDSDLEVCSWEIGHTGNNDWLVFNVE